MVKKKKKKTRKSIRNIIVTKELNKDYGGEYSKDIEELERKKKERLEPYSKELKEKKGFFKKVGTYIKAKKSTRDIDRQIAYKKRYISNEQKLKLMKQQSQLNKQKEELNEYRKKRIKQYNFNELNTPRIKPIKYEDILG